MINPYLLEVLDSFCLHVLKKTEKFLATLHRYMEIHGTVYYETQRPPEVPAFVKNHGLLPQQELQQLLRKAKVGGTGLKSWWVQKKKEGIGSKWEILSVWAVEASYKSVHLSMSSGHKLTTHLVFFLFFLLSSSSSDLASPMKVPPL